MRILIVDDCHQIRNLMNSVITSLGHTVVGQAGDGIEAVELARQLQPDVITMDINMPRMNGMEAIRMLEAEGCLSRIIVITGETESIMAMNAKHVVKCLTKPFSVKDIASTLDHIARRCS